MPLLGMVEYITCIGDVCTECEDRRSEEEVVCLRFAVYVEKRRDRLVGGEGCGVAVLVD